MPIGEWSSWDDFDVVTGDGIEVEERKLHRVKNEIMEWSDWTDTIPPKEYFELWPEYVEEKEAVDKDGWIVTMWRIYGFNNHYSEWSKWTDDEMQYRSSSGDIVEEKTQRRYCRI